MKIKNFIYSIFVITSLDAGEFKKFNLPLSKLDKKETKEQILANNENWRQISFINSAEKLRLQRAESQEFVRSLQSIETPKKDKDTLAYENHVLALKAMLNLFRNPVYCCKNLQEEHEKTKLSFATLQELLSIFLYHAQNNKNDRERGMYYFATIVIERARYYKEYFYSFAKNLQERSHTIVKETGKITTQIIEKAQMDLEEAKMNLEKARLAFQEAETNKDDEAIRVKEAEIAIIKLLAEKIEIEKPKIYFVKSFLYCTSVALYDQARFFYEQSNAMENYDNLPEEARIYVEEVLNQEAKKDHKGQEKAKAEKPSEDREDDELIIEIAEEQKLPILIEKVKKKIEGIPSYQDYQEKLKILEPIIEENKKNFNDMIAIKLEIEEFSDAIPSVPKNKKEREDVQTAVNIMINLYNISMDGAKNKTSRDNYKQSIEYLSNLLESGDYSTLVKEAHKFAVHEKKNGEDGLYEKLLELEDDYINLASFYLELFNILPQSQHVEYAEKVKESILKIEEYRNRCNPNNVTIPNKRKELFNRIEIYKKIINYDFSFAHDVKEKDDKDWLLSVLDDKEVIDILQRYQISAILHEIEIQKKEATKAAIQWTI